MSRVLPLAIYAIPEISMVGLTEDECKAKRIPHLIGRSYYENNPRGQIIGDMSGMIKLVFSPEDKRLLGAHIIGEQASELIHIAAHVMLSNGTLDTFIDAVYNYPTLADLYKYAAYDGLGNLEKWLASNHGA
jgi:NAD(P) transhydrogenase